MDFLSPTSLYVKGMENLKPDSCYDSLFLSADSRNKADWILGINASYAMCKATGFGNNSLDGCRHRYWLPSADATVKGRTIFHRTAGPSTSACKRTASFQDAPHTGSSRQRIRYNVFSGLQAGTSGTDYRYQSQRKGNTSTGSV